MKEVFKTTAKPIIIQNKNFRSIIVRFLFPFEIKDEEIGLVDLLPAMLVNTSKNYPTEQAFLKEYMKRYIGSLTMGVYNIGTNGFYSVTMVLPDPLYLEEDHLEESISFMIDAIYDPDVKDGQFKEEQFQKEKTSLLDAIDNSMKNIYRYSGQRFLQLVDDSGILKNNIYNHREMVEKITAKDLYSFYQDKIQTKQPLVFILGNINEEKWNRILDKYLYKEQHQTISFEKNYYMFQTSKGLQEKEEKKNFNQSRLMIGFKVKDMKEEDRLVLRVIDDLLSSQTSYLLKKVLRDELGIVYSTSSHTYSYYGILEIDALIHRNNKDKAQQGIKKVMNQLKRKEIVEPLLEKVKELYYLEMLEGQDSKRSLLGDYIVNYLGYSQVGEEEYENLKKITAEDIVHFVPRLQLDTIYYLEGLKDGK